MKTQDTEETRMKYMPSKIKVLFVGEAPPDALDRFFYYENVQTADFLFLGIMKCLMPGEIKTFIKEHRSSLQKRKMLERFRRDGYFLMDLSTTPAEFHLPELEKNDFIKRLSGLEAQGVLDKSTPIILIKTNVYDCLYHILSNLGYNVVNERIPFPASGQQKHFETGFKKAMLSIQQTDNP